MATETFLTLILSSVLAVALAVGAYAMSIVVIKPRLARACVWSAWFSIMLLCAWYGGTNEMQRLLRYSLAALIGGGTTVLLAVALDYIKGEEIAAKRPVESAVAPAHTMPPTISNVGKIEAPNAETILSVRDRAVGRLIQIGQSSSFIDFAAPQGVPFLQFANNYELTIDSVGGGLEVSTQVRDRQGHIVAELIKNEWKVAPPPRTWDRNYNRTALEVRDEDGNVVLQVRLFPDRVQIQGEWWMDENRGIRIVGYPGEGGRFEIFGTKFRPNDADPIRQMFVYPSDNHWGELVPTSPPTESPPSPAPSAPL